MIDHMLFQKAFWTSLDKQSGTVNINGKTRNIGVSHYKLGTRVTFNINDPDNSISMGDTGTIIGSLGFVAKPDVSDELMSKCLQDKIQADHSGDATNGILVKLDKGKTVYVPGSWANLF